MPTIELASLIYSSTDFVFTYFSGNLSSRWYCPHSIFICCKMNAQLFFCKGGCFSLLYFVCPFLQFDFFRVGLKNEIANQNNKNKNNSANDKNDTIFPNKINNC